MLSSHLGLLLELLERAESTGGVLRLQGLGGGLGPLHTGIILLPELLLLLGEQWPWQVSGWLSQK